MMGWISTAHRPLVHLATAAPQPLWVHIVSSQPFALYASARLVITASHCGPS